MTRGIRGTYFAFHLLLGLLLLFLTGALWNNHTRLVKVAKQWWCGRALAILNISVEVRGRPPMPTDGKGLLFVSNHISWTDIPLIGSQVKLNFLSKAEVKQWPLIGFIATGVGTLYIERGQGGSSSVAQQIADYLQQGRSVVFFPEGTTTDGQDVKKFFRQLFNAAVIADTLLCPVAIHYEVKGRPDNPVAFVGDDAFHSHLWQLLRLDGIKATVTFLPPFKADPNDLRCTSNQARDQIRSKVLALNTSVEPSDSGL